MCLMAYANNKGADQPAHPRSLISAFVVCCLDSVMSLVSVTKISSLMLASVAAQAGLCLAWSETPEDTFSHGVAHMNRKSHDHKSTGSVNHLCKNLGLHIFEMIHNSFFSNEVKTLKITLSHLISYSVTMFPN